MPYLISDAKTGEILSRHRTKRAVLDNWLQFKNRPVKIEHFQSGSPQRAVMAACVWYEPPLR